MVTVKRNAIPCNRMHCPFPYQQRHLLSPCDCLSQFDCERAGDFKIYGIGDFGVSSFEIWVRGMGRTIHPADKNLAGFCNWLRTQPDTPLDEQKPTITSGGASAAKLESPLPRIGAKRSPRKSVAVKSEPVDA